MVGNVELVIDLCRFTPKKETTEEDTENKNPQGSSFIVLPYEYGQCGASPNKNVSAWYFVFVGWPRELPTA